MDLRTRFEAEGVQIAARGGDPGELSLRLARLGREDDLRPVGPASPAAEGNRVEYRRGGGLTEWYLHGPPGLEQGFTLEQRPAGEGELVVEVELGGPLTPRLAAGGQAIELVDRTGTERLRYVDLFARDADGAPLPCHLELRAGMARLVVEDGGARYPLEIDPLVQTFTAQLLPVDGTGYGYFGHRVALDTDTLVIGAPGDAAHATIPGTVYVFVRVAGVWSLQAKLQSADGVAEERFGSSVAVSGNTLAVGAPGDSSLRGWAYVYVRSGTTWTRQQKLQAPDFAAGDTFGDSVALDLDTLAVGAPYDDDGEDDSGSIYVFVRASGAWSLQAKLAAIYPYADYHMGRAVALDGNTVAAGCPARNFVEVFVRSGTTWSHQTKFHGSDSVQGDSFGWSVALEGNTLVAGAHYDDNGIGSAYVFTRSGTIWSEQQKLTDAEGEVGDNFGESAAISVDTIAVGSYRDDDGLGEAGSAFVFLRSGTTWSLQQKLLAPAVDDTHHFGHSVALSGQTAVIGAPTDHAAGFYAGSVYVFVRVVAVWSQEQKLTSSDGRAGDHFGAAAAASGDTVVIGAPEDDDRGADSGSAQVFVRSGLTWPRQQVLLAPDGAAGDSFGVAVAISGDTLVVGADGNAASASLSGAAYVFVRSGATWTLQQKLTASDAEANDHFGWSVAISGNTILVGAPYNDSPSMSGSAYVFVRSGAVWTEQQKLIAPDAAASDFFGAVVSLDVNSALIGAYYDDDLGADSGSTYVFVRSGTTWTLQQKLTAPDGAAGDWFGYAVAISGDRAAVGAPRDDDLGANSGSAHVFTRSGTTWSQEQKLTGYNGAAADQFGFSVALWNDLLAVGAPYMDDPSGIVNCGKTGLFWRTAGAWASQYNLSGSYPNPMMDGDNFGSAVALSDGQVVVGAPNDDSCSLADSGSAKVLGFILGDGSPCPGSLPCESGFCVDGVCCNSACGGGATDDCMACSVAAGAPSNGYCQHLSDAAAPTVVCRPASDVCDAAETCTSLHMECPYDDLRPSSFVCRAAGGACDLAETCTGGAAACPPDGFLPPTQVCRISAGACDLAETCTGTGVDCPLDGFLPALTGCRPAAGVCDLPEACTGAGADCPPDGFLPADAECRGAAGVCDLPESCTGTGADCPLDGFTPASVECRASSGVCDLPEACSGGSADCPPDGFLPASTECRAAAGVCDLAESCSGSSAACPGDAYQLQTVQCRPSAGICDLAESCTGVGASCPADAYQAENVECRPAAGACDTPERCTGEEAGCPTDALQPSGFECRSATCEDGVETDPAVCNGLDAACPAETTAPCAPFVCGPDACLAACSGPGDCSVGHRCEGGSCVAAGAQGDPCLAAAECQSGLCVDGFCCDTSCTAQCEACDLAGAEGACGPVEGDPHGERSPCTSDGSACAGACDGIEPTACAYPGAETACREASCTNAIAVLAATCQGTGACPAEQTQDCAPAECDGVVCGGGCTLDTDCADRQYCSAGVCVDKLAQGEGCAGDLQCQDGLCVDGFCCDGACTGQCEACDLAGSEGACGPVEGVPHGGRAGCAGSGVCQGSCDGQDPEDCVFPAAGSECAASACAEGLFTPAGTCDGTGSCGVSSQQPCAPYACGDGACLTACTSDQDCASGTECSGGECRQLEASSGCGCGAQGAASQPTAGIFACLAALLVLAGLRLGHRRRWRAPRPSEGGRS
ncbi:MAG TPA: hypothetical protein PK668_28265 [Myxococcota bacterium]|nr:hypothetical protein [Myxococcota bacterium]HRY97398.1 hypothetical protein [Myxococcota bacterium]